jgi:hypothetical protein
VIVSERLTYVAPLGVRFLDPATSRPVADGLVVRAAGRPAFANRAGVFVLTGVPGLGVAERGAGDDAYWAEPPARTTVTVDVDDPRGRFLPFSFDADLPARGAFELACGSPPGVDGPIVLFSSAARPVPAGCAVVRAESWPVRLRAFAAPQAGPVPPRPDLCTVLTQPEATLLAGASPATPLTDATLDYGRELVLRTSAESVLVVTPA